ncbi:hypothetical protein Ciccas_007691 [Cichlidogyrus casuarinus]|uniref:mRNA-capping enzyme n=1 Tax=Cichlidogyrus casuarinus TaxID=1844966 RepID=A0ABD2Q3B4_9PLAT
MASRGGLPNLPPRWKKCPRMGDLIMNIFIPFKTPLDEKFTHYLQNDELFDVDMIFRSAQPYSLGMIIDLTKSRRFYNRKEIETKHVKYVKIECKGNEECPTEDQVSLFTGLVNQFRDSHPEDSHKIGVHCTHGFNRTGFLIVAYLVNEFDYSVDAAVQMFADARPPGIYKQDYLDELFKRFGDPDETPNAPERPEWCNEDDGGNPLPRAVKHQLEDDDDTSFDSSAKTAKHSDSDIGGGRLPPAPFGNPVFISGVCGVDTLDQNSVEAHQVRELANNLVLMGGFTFGSNGETLSAAPPEESLLTEAPKPKVYASHDGLTPMKPILKVRDKPLKFRGSQPVSMTLENLQRVLHHSYSISYKADGTRYLLLIWKRDHVYLIDRGNFVYKASCLQFPTMHWVHLRHSKKDCAERFEEDPYGHLANCLLDGEMVLVEDEHDKLRHTPHFLIYDVVAMYGRSYGHRTFEERYNAIENHVIRPRAMSMQANWMNSNEQNFPVSRKKFYPVFEIERLLDPHLGRKLRIELDGIIFQPSGPEDKYMLGTCPTTLKWKPPELNSVDFLCKVYRMNKSGCLPEVVADLYLGGQNTYCIRLPERNSSDLQYDGKIVECTFDFQLRSWKFLRVRTDKTEPNHVTSGSG